MNYFEAEYAMQPNPFDQSALKRIFQFDDIKSNRLTSRENSTLEFKEAFNWNSRESYAKTMAGFANAKGGYLVFGIKNKPRELKGLVTNNFEDLDPSTVTQFLNTTFSPEINWEMLVMEFSGLKIGLIYTFEAQRKPVMCMRQSGSELREADIYYRYKGRTERIHYAELKSLLEEERRIEQRLWLKHLSQIATIGVADAAIFNPHDGVVRGSGGSFVINEDLLPKLRFVKEGQFEEKSGAPTLRLVGDVQSVSGKLIRPTRQTVVYKNIRSVDIITAFLDKDKVAEPMEYVKNICFESSAYLPIYYFLSLASQDTESAISELAGIEVQNSQTKDKLIDRLKQQHEDFVNGSLDSRSAAAASKKKFVEQILAKTLSNTTTGRELIYQLQAITHIPKSKVEWDYLSAFLKAVFRNRYSSEIGDPFRKAICYLDQLLYKRAQRKKIMPSVGTVKEEPPAWRSGDFAAHPQHGLGLVKESYYDDGRYLLRVKFQKFAEPLLIDTEIVELKKTDLERLDDVQDPVPADNADSTDDF